MSKGISLHIGINKLDFQNYYKGTSFAELTLAVTSANLMAKIAASQGFNEIVPGSVRANKTLINKSANIYNFEFYIQNCSKVLKEGDVFLLTYAGHGSERPSTNSTEPKDQTLCLYDGELIDNRIQELFSCFKPGVRIIFIADSCHSGTLISKRILKNYLEKLPDDFDFEALDKRLFIKFSKDFDISEKDSESVGIRELEITLNMLDTNLAGLKKRMYSLPKINSLPKVLADFIHQRRLNENGEIIKATSKKSEQKILKSGINTDVSIIQISACEDDKVTTDGVFTNALDYVWNYQNPINYCDFRSKIESRLTDQVVPLVPAGNDSVLNQKFRAQKPFTVSAPL